MRRQWMKLDNAAKVFAHVDSDYITTVFRMSHVLHLPVDPQLLLKALNDVIGRFPYYKVRLKKGIFWYYLEDNPLPLKVFFDEGAVCRRIVNSNTNDYLFRILYKENTISCEFHHLLADGTGCLVFLNTLVTRYAELCGLKVSFNSMNRNYNESPEEEETIDSYKELGKKYHHTIKPKREKVRRVFHLRGWILSRRIYLVTQATVEQQTLYEVAKSYGAKVTEFLTAIYLQVLLEVQEEQVKLKKLHVPVAIQLPVDLRRRLPSKSLRNFTLYITPGLEPNASRDLSSIIETVKTYIRKGVKEEHLLEMIVQNYKVEKSPFLRIAPLFLKELVLPIFYKTKGVDLYSGALSNIGNVELPDGVKELVREVHFISGPCPISKNNLAVTGYEGKLTLSFGRVIKAAYVERKFLRKLVDLGIPVFVSRGDQV